MKMTTHTPDSGAPALVTLSDLCPSWKVLALQVALSLGLILMFMPSGQAAATAEHHPAAAPAAAKAMAKASAVTPSAPSAAAVAAPEERELIVDLKAALKDKMIDKKSLSLVIKDKPTPRVAATTEHGAVHGAPASAHAQPAIAARARTPAVRKPTFDHANNKASTLQAHAPATDGHSDEVHWAYAGENGPQAWGKLKPEFNVCAIGKRQSPINIEDSNTLQGPAEPLAFNYTASSGVVVNNGHTIQVDVSGDNSLTVRNSVFKLVQFHFHTPSEEQVNFRSYAMVAHLVHKNNEGQLAVVAVLLDPGTANTLINKVWTYMPLDTSDRVRMPTGLLDLNELLPKDQRYYQFIGSLTTPPCTEGVLWMVLKQPTSLSREQIRLFQQLFPNNARPVQALNGRAVREAQSVNSGTTPARD